MSRRLVLLCCSMLTVLLALVPGAATAVDSAAGRLVADQPANGTPHVLDGRVLSVAQVGGTIVLGGSFSRTRNDDSATELPRRNLMAFDEATGRISTTFLPNTDGEVTTVIPAGDGSTVFVGGGFSTIGGVARSNLARVRVSDGAVLPGFDAGRITGKVRDLRLSGGRLWIAGSFTHVGGNAQRALATVSPATGAFDPYMRSVVDGVHNGGFTSVSKIDVSAPGDRLLAVGNFATLDTQPARQVFMLDLSDSAAQKAPFQTSFYSAPCLSTVFDTYMRDLDFSPDGQFFVISTTGAYGGSEGPCDTTARFETYAAGDDTQPSWVDYTGGDTTYAVEITDTAVYTGGHARWQNNPYAGDTAGQGAVDRPGIAALDPLNGLPMSWNPTRTRGIGVFDFLVTSRGLWVASDTDRIGTYIYKGRIALLPLAGSVVPAVRTPGLPNDVYAFGALGAASDPRVLYRVNSGGPALPASTGVDWAADTESQPSPFHNRVGNRATWSPVGSVDATVPTATPRGIFADELWDPNGGPEQSWDFPVEAGVPLEVRLYFANRCDCTREPGTRAFDVDVDGTRVLDDFDVSAVAGHDVGTMRSFQVTSDGNVDVDLFHVVENPMISAIEVLRTDLPGIDSGQIVNRSNDGSAFGASTPVETGGIDWNQVRGAFMLRGQLYLAHADGTFDRRTFDGTTYGDPVAVDASDRLVVLQYWRDDISRMTGITFDSGRIYYTLAGSDQLFYRYFTPESDVVGAKRYVASGSVAGVDFSQVRGMFTTGTHLFWASPDGSLNRTDWAEGPQSDTPVAGSTTQVSGTSVDGADWASRGLFLFQDGAGDNAGQTPIADIQYSCTSLDCAFSSAGSSSPGTTITSRSWDFGDGATSSGANPSHAFAEPGTYTVRLTIGTANGRSATTDADVIVEQENRAPLAEFTAGCQALECSFDASGSSDPDGDDLTYSWDFGDGQSATGAQVQHDYAAAGARTVTLTVSDGSLQAQAQREVLPSAAVDTELAYVGAASTSGNRSTHQVSTPTDVEPGDQLVLFFTNNSTNVTVEDPAGWTLVESRDGSGIRGRAWTRTATAADAGRVVSVSTSGFTKSTMSIAAYRSNTGSAAVTSSASAVTNSPASTHTAPDTEVTEPSSWVVHWWGEKSSSPTTWSTTGVTDRTTDQGTGGGKTSALLADSGAAVGIGQHAGATATTNADVNRAVLFTLAVAPR